jgi:hypothetical protein
MTTNDAKKIGVFGASAIVAFSGATRAYLAASVIVMLGVSIFYAGKDRTEFKRKMAESTKHQTGGGVA